MGARQVVIGFPNDEGRGSEGDLRTDVLQFNAVTS